MVGASQDRTRIALLGAERQAATSFAMAWPERGFLFVSDQPVIDGWDLGNVEIVPPVAPDAYGNSRALEAEGIPLCPRWIGSHACSPANNLGRFDLEAVMDFLGSRFPHAVLPVQHKPFGDRDWIAKGNRWHRPDAVVLGSPADAWLPGDPYGCGIVFQEYLQGAGQLLAVGRRTEAGAVSFGLVAVHLESIGRDDALIAGETVHDPRIAERTLEMLHALGHQGFFSISWLCAGKEARLSSFRPVPRAVFRTLRKAGIDCLSMKGSEVCLAGPGHQFIADIHYASYGRAAAR